MRDFNTDITTGQKPEELFEELVMNELKKEVFDVRRQKKWQKRGIDYGIVLNEKEKKLLTVDVKKGMPNGNVVIEESSNWPELDGWFYTSQADCICYACCTTKTLIFLRLSARMKEHYARIKEQYRLIKNEPSTRDGHYWQSAFRLLPVEEFEEFVRVTRLE